MLPKKSQRIIPQEIPAAAIPGHPGTEEPAPGQADALCTGTRALLIRIKLVNTILRQDAADTVQAVELARACAIQLGALQAMAQAGNPTGVRSAASRLRVTLRMLRDTYLRLTGTGTLPVATVAALRAVVRSLESAAGALDATIAVPGTRPGRTAAIGRRQSVPVSCSSRAPCHTAPAITPAREVSALM